MEILYGAMHSLTAVFSLTLSSSLVTSSPSRSQVVIAWEYQFVGLSPIIENEWFNELSSVLQRELLHLSERRGEVVAYESHDGCVVPLLTLLNTTQYSKSQCKRFSIRAVIPASKRVDLLGAVYIEMFTLQEPFCAMYPTYCESLLSIDVSVDPSLPSVTPFLVLPIVVLACVVLLLLVAVVYFYKRIRKFNSKLREKQQLLYQANANLLHQEGMMPQVPAGVPNPYYQRFITPLGEIYYASPVRFVQ